MVVTRSRARKHVIIDRDTIAKMSRPEKMRHLKLSELKMNKACSTVVLLNDRIVHLSRRYYRARTNNHKSFRYNLRVKIAVFEGVRNVYYEYARDRAEEVAELRRDLFNQRVTIVSASDREDESDDYSDMADSDDMAESDSDFSEED